MRLPVCMQPQPASNSACMHAFTRLRLLLVVSASFVAVRYLFFDAQALSVSVSLLTGCLLQVSRIIKERKETGAFSGSFSPICFDLSDQVPQTLDPRS